MQSQSDPPSTFPLHNISIILSDLSIFWAIISIETTATKVTQAGKERQAMSFISSVFNLSLKLKQPRPATQLQSLRFFASKQHKSVLRQTKGFRGKAKNCYTIAIRRLQKSWQYMYVHRRLQKREWRKLWIIRVNAGVSQYGESYSRFFSKLNKSNITLNRKVLAELAAQEPFSFKAVVDVANMG